MLPVTASCRRATQRKVDEGHDGIQRNNSILFLRQGSSAGA